MLYIAVAALVFVVGMRYLKETIELSCCYGVIVGGIRFIYTAIGDSFPLINAGFSLRIKAYSFDSLSRFLSFLVLPSSLSP